MRLREDIARKREDTVIQRSQKIGIVPVSTPEEDVQWVAYKLSGAAVPNLTDALAFKIWLLCFVIASASVREDMAEWTYWIANYSPPWAAYHAIMSAHLVSL